MDKINKNILDALTDMESIQSTTVTSSSVINELTYQAYRVYRSQHTGPSGNTSFKRWVQLGGKDNDWFQWPYHPPNRGAGSYRRGGVHGLWELQEGQRSWQQRRPRGKMNWWKPCGPCS
ncbi:uncharacterized protein LOC105844707 [Hydra vulgaris]|uniref:uncharacterized protein LOC105844707 n=1 Tax=Hydra vulgaris TaxID=6087 RepID=UPI001F5E5244|nr:uncharacterized protein LOC105844707 [Hydra vulgaris]